MKLKRALLVHPNRDIADVLAESLKQSAKTVGCSLIIDYERNAEDARTRIETESYHLVITHLVLPETSTSAPGANRRGLELLRYFRRLKPSSPAILITVLPPDLELKQDISELKIIDTDESGDCLARIVELSKRRLKGISPEDRLSITFVQDPKSNVWSCQVGGQTLEETFEIKDPVVDGLLTESRVLGFINHFPEWMDMLRKLGGDLRSALFDTNPVLSVRLRDAINAVGGVSNTRLCFKVSQAVYEIALEAVLEPPQTGVVVRGYAGKDIPFWMLKAPVYRRIKVENVPQLRSPLFEDGRENLNFLIIEAPTEGLVSLEDGLQLQLSHLNNVVTECTDLEKWLRSKPSLLGAGEVRRISESTLGPGESFKDRLCETLEEKPWHIIHYSGHSFYRRRESPDSGTGYVFLPGNPVLPVEAGIFASWIKDAQLVFLTSCHSSEEKFVFEMARHLIPTVIGFRWDLDDDIATSFVRDWFYPSLLKDRSVEKAFQNARSAAYQSYPQKQIWAAPVLIVHEQQEAIAA